MPAYQSLIVKSSNVMWRPRTFNSPETAAPFPEAPRKTTFAEASALPLSGPTLCAGYVPVATSTTCPGLASRYARSKLLHGSDSVHRPVSLPVGDKKRDVVAADVDPVARTRLAASETVRIRKAGAHCAQNGSRMA